MGKFSDPNYKLLKDYFDILVAERTGTDKSYLIGPNKTVVSDGGVYTILYEDHPDRGYVGHRFTIDSITGNRFKMTYQGVENDNLTITTGPTGSPNTLTTSVELSAFGIGNDFYFRKDSFFHFWLARPTQDDVYHDYCNQEKTFLFFGKIWPSGLNQYVIEFEGLKDFTLHGLPEHNQTINMIEWLKVYWDQVHHEMYSMTKHFWSMFDAREIDIRWLAYIAQIYGIEISETILNELTLREWVENLPYFLKRIGTYNALYIIWKVFMQNTNNKLNVYERWGEWCTQTLDKTFGGVKDSFVDHHFLEFYGIQPSGGAGEEYYSQYDPVNYPTHTLTAPASCGTFSWNLGVAENFLATNYENLNCSIGQITGETIEVTGYDPQRTTTAVMYISGGNYSGDFTHSIGVEMDVATSGSSNLVFWGMANEVAMMSDMIGDFICLSYEITPSNGRYFQLSEYEGGVLTNYVNSSFPYLGNRPYYVIITRTGSTLSATIFDRERKWADDFVESISIGTLTDVDTYSNLYFLNTIRKLGHGRWYGTIYSLYTQDISYTRTVGASGNPVITPHYKVQIDLSTEPLGDIFDDATIISENVITELYRNFEYVRPSMKYAHYEELIAPFAQVDRVGDSISLYSRQSNGFFNTFFTGSQYLSAGGNTGLGGVATSSHFQQFATKIWTITHELDSTNLLVQPWIFTGIDADNAKMIIPDSIQIIDNETVQIIFNESYRGIVSIAAPVTGQTGVTYVNSVSASPSASWGIQHNLDTNTPTGSAGVGYYSPPGPVVMHWDNNGYRMFPEVNYMITDDRLDVTWDSDTGDGSDFSAAGISLVRRSDYYHIQSDPSDEWIIEHNLNSFVIPQFYRRDASIANDKEFFPVEVTAVDENTLRVNWDSIVRGYAHIVQVPRERVVYSPYTCDKFGIGMCADVLGYWKVGTGESTIWNPFVENDLESPVASGTFYKIEDDVNTIFIDFIVPENIDPVDIKEVGLFNYLDDLILYSRSSGLYKPDNVQTYFHYRIEKLNSSSSSSQSSSSTSSSSESSSSSSSSSSLSSSSSSLSSSSSSTSLSSSSSSTSNFVPTGLDWTFRSTPNIAHSIGYGDNQFVAGGQVIGGVNGIMTSPDGDVWTQRNAQGSTIFYTVSYTGSNGYIAMGSGSDGTQYSSDGITWTIGTQETSGLTWRGSAYGQPFDRIVGVSQQGYIASSDDGGANWTNRLTGAGGTYGVTFAPSGAGGLFVVVSSSGTNRAITSPDGITWTFHSCPSYTWRDVTYSPDISGGMFVAVANTGNVMHSFDGKNWILGTCPNKAWIAVRWSSEIQMFAATAFSGTSQRSMFSLDGINWTLANTPADHQWWDLAASSGSSLNRFVAVNSNIAASAAMVGIPF